jgi:hypothetical protein
MRKTAEPQSRRLPWHDSFRNFRIPHFAFKLSSVFRNPNSELVKKKGAPAQGRLGDRWPDGGS